MKSLRYLLAAVILGLALAPLPASAGVNDFTIPAFEADYYLSRDDAKASRLRVHERLVATFPDFDQNHGIERAIPQTYEGHKVGLDIQSVTDDRGQALNFTQSRSNDNLVLRIGDADKFVHGQQTYIIDYTLSNVTTNQAGYDGFFWDVNGNQWQQQFGQVTARIHIPSELAGGLQTEGTRCFTGAAGSTASDCTITTDTGGEDKILTFNTSRPLQAGENLTIESRFAPGTFAKYQMPLTEAILRILFIVFIVVLPVPLAAGFMFRQWRRYGKDPQGRGVIIPEYVPPKKLSVLSSSAVLTESFQTKAISATLLDLAIRGFLKIYESKEDRLLADKTSYDIELVKAPTGLSPEEASVIGLVFSTPEPAVGTRVSLDSLKNKLYSGAATIGKDVNHRLATSGYFRTEPSKAKTPYLIAGFVIIGLSFFFLPGSIMLIVAGVIVLIFANFMPARTAAGVEARDYLLGLKHFITVAEADRIKALQSPHGDLTEKIDVTDTTKLVKLYERLLPFAMLFGIEKDWAKQFAGLYQQPPDWYSGTSSFNAAYFAGSMSGFNSASSSSFTAPSSSGSGGSSGGGGGGGGGGGW